MKFGAFRKKNQIMVGVSGVTVAAFGLFSLAVSAQEPPRRSISPESQVKSDEDGENAIERGWLGVSIEAVSESTVQLGTQARGVMVGGVVEASPADTAGILAYDMIVAMNGEDVESDVGPVVDLIKSRRPARRSTWRFSATGS